MSLSDTCISASSFEVERRVLEASPGLATLTNLKRLYTACSYSNLWEKGKMINLGVMHDLYITGSFSQNSIIKNQLVYT